MPAWSYAILLGCVASLVVSGATVNLNPVADAYTAGGTLATQNFGTAATLQVRQPTTEEGKRRSYLRFDLSSIPSGASITSAVLELHVISTAANAPYSVHNVPTDNWGETAIVWNGQPTYDATALATGTVASGPTTLSITLTSYISQEFAGDKVPSLVIRDATSVNKLITMDSRESTTPSYRPVLVVTYNSTPPPLTLTGPASSGEVGVSYSSSLVAGGGTPPYTYSISSGSLPPGLTLNASTGAIAGTPTTAGTYPFTGMVTDSLSATATGNYSIVIAPAVTLTGPTSNGEVGVSYSSSLAASGGVTPYTYSISSGSLPPGLTLNASTGAITGTPTTAGTYPFTGRVTDSLNGTATGNYSIVIAAAVTLTGPASSGEVGVSYSSSLVASGGVTPYTYSISSGSLPPGLTLNASTGAITGTPTTAGTYPFTGMVTDSLSATATGNYSITISPASGNQTLNPVADAYTAGGTLATQNFGTAATLQICQPTTEEGKRRSYLRFDLSGITAPSVTSAVLQLHVISTAANAPYSVHNVPTTTWGETTITWNGQPVYDATALATGTVVSGPTTISIDLTSYVNQKLAGDKVASLVIRDATSVNKLITLDSRESTTPGFRPALVVSSVPAPLTLAGPILTGQVDVAYNSSLVASGGTPPYTYSISSGSLAPPLALNASTGAITGTPNAAGTYNCTAQVTDAALGAATADCTITISPQSNYTFGPGVPIFVDASEASQIQRAIQDLQRDLKKVLGVDSPVVYDEASIAGQPAIVVTSTGAATASYRDPSLTGWENHSLRAAGNSSAPRIVLQGTDKRGTIYAIYEFADRYLDIPPLWYWASWQPQTQSSFTVSNSLNLQFGSPAVRYRGWFPNDIDLLATWMNASSANSDAFFETLLRLKYNLLDVDHISDIGGADLGLGWARKCRDRGITVTFTHLAPFGGLLKGSWDNYWNNVAHQTPPARLLSNQAALDQFWTYFINLSLRENLDVIQSIELRCDADTGFWNCFLDAPGSDSARATTISNMLAHELNLLKSVTGNPAPLARTVFYNEVAGYMAAGLMSPPDNTNFTWTFSNNQRDHFTPPEVTNYVATSRPVGYYMNLQFYTTGSHLTAGEGPWKVERNNDDVWNKAGTGNFWLSILNVGNFREFAMEAALGADLMWNHNTYTTDASLQRFCERYFGTAQASQIATLYTSYYNAYWRQKLPDLPSFDRQYIFEDLRYARAAEAFINQIKSGTYNGGLLGSSSYYRVVPGDSGASDDPHAVVNGTNASVAALQSVVSTADSIYAALPARYKVFFNDNLRQQAYFMLYINQFMNSLADALINLGHNSGDLSAARTALDNAQNSLSQRESGPVFSTWYDGETKFGINHLRSIMP